MFTRLGDFKSVIWIFSEDCLQCNNLGGEGGGVLPYMGYIDMSRCEGYGFQAVNSRIGYINQSVWV